MFFHISYTFSFGNIFYNINKLLKFEYFLIWNFVLSCIHSYIYLNELSKVESIKKIYKENLKIK